MFKLLDSTTQPVWASSSQLGGEWGDVQRTYLAIQSASQEVERFLEKDYSTEDDIKTALKNIQKVSMDEKLMVAKTSLIRECLKNTALPVPGQGQGIYR